MTLLRVESVSKSFRVGSKQIVYALSDVSFTMQQSESLGIIGESGSGKSTLGRIILGLTKADSGNVSYDDDGYNDLAGRPHPEFVQAVFQEPYESLNPRRRVLSIVREPLDVNRRKELKKSDRDELARSALRSVGLPDTVFDRYPKALSGGQQQRVGIARALVLHPSLLVLDEPTSSLDVSVRAQVLTILAMLKRELGIAMLYISHDIGSVQIVADRIAVMHHGSLMEIGVTEDVLNSPAHAYTRALLDARMPLDPDAGAANVALNVETSSPDDASERRASAQTSPEAASALPEVSLPMQLVGEGHWVRCISKVSNE